MTKPILTPQHHEQIKQNIAQGRPWNTGLRYKIELTAEQRERRSVIRRGKGLGPRPQLWITGPDPVVKALRRRWLLAKNQAKFWSQEWHLDWDTYRDLLLDHAEQLGRSGDSLNLVRRDTEQGWTPGNVEVRERQEAMHRPTKGRQRIRPKGLGKGLHHWRAKKNT